MENSNSREYLEKITAAVIDNLRQTGPAPSVQMQDVPRKFGGMTDEEEAELDDLDEDENKDVRMTEHRWDKRVQHENEFEPSDDEDLAAANGVTPRNGNNKRSYTDFRKGENEDNSARASPAVAADASTNGGATEGPAAEDSQDINDETIEDFAEGEQEKASVDKKAKSKEPEKEKETEKEGEEEKEIEKEKEEAKVDEDGDVGMADSEPKEEMTIKKEDVEPEPAPDRVPSKSPVVEEKTTEESETTAAPAPPTEPAEPADTAEPAEEAAVQEEEKPSEAEPEKKSPEPSSDAKEKEADAPDAMEVDQEKDEEEPKKASTPPA